MRVVSLTDRQGIVVNRIVLGDAPYTPPAGLTMREGGQLGQKWDGREWVDIVPPPAPVTRLGTLHAQLEKQALTLEELQEMLVLERK